MSKASIILSAGKQSRWDGHYPKQLLKVGGETLISRMRRQMFTEHDTSPVIIAEHPEIITMYAEHCYIPNDSNTVIDSLMSSSELWGVNTYILLGDVFYTKDALQKLTTAHQHKMVFGDEAEIYAMRFYSGQISQLLTAVKRVKMHPNSEGKLWNLYRALEGYRDDEYKLGSRFCLIEDETRDFDYVEDYLSFMESSRE